MSQISVPTSLGPPSRPQLMNHDEFIAQCNELATALAKAVVRRVEEYCRDEIDRAEQSGDSPVVPSKLIAWKDWANEPTPTPLEGALPGPLDLSRPSKQLGESMDVDLTPLLNDPVKMAEGNKLKLTSLAIEGMCRELRAFDIDDWHDQ